MNDLRTLTLIECEHRPFIYALNPEMYAGAVACPNLEDLILCTAGLGRLRTPELKEMASARAERHAKRLSIMIVSLGKMLPEEELLALREYFSCVDCKMAVESPKWDALPGDGMMMEGIDWWRR